MDPCRWMEVFKINPHYMLCLILEMWRYSLWGMSYTLFMISVGNVLFLNARALCVSQTWGFKHFTLTEVCILQLHNKVNKQCLRCVWIDGFHVHIIWICGTHYDHCDSVMDELNKLLQMLCLLRAHQLTCCITRDQRRSALLNTLGPRQNGGHFPGGIFF